MLICLHMARLLLSVSFVWFWDGICGDWRGGVLREFCALRRHGWIVDEFVLSSFAEAVVDYRGVNQRDPEGESARQGISSCLHIYRLVEWVGSR